MDEYRVTMIKALRTKVLGVCVFLTLSTMVWAGDQPQTTHGESSIEFKSFAVPTAMRHRKDPRAHLPVEAAPDSGPLWDFIAGKIKSAGTDPDPDRDVSEYAPVGPHAYLAIMSTGYIYLAQPERDVLQYLTRVQHADELDPLSFRSLPKEWAWALVHASDLEHGRFSEGFGALFVDLSGKSEPAVMYFDIAGFLADNDGEGPELCADPSEAQDPLADTPLASSQHVESFSVADLNHDGLDDVVIHASDQDCKTRKLRKLRYVFMNKGHGFGVAKISNDTDR